VALHVGARPDLVSGNSIGIGWSGQFDCSVCHYLAWWYGLNSGYKYHYCSYCTTDLRIRASRNCLIL
jgi:hypothetical protein